MRSSTKHKVMRGKPCYQRSHSIVKRGLQILNASASPYISLLPGESGERVLPVHCFEDDKVMYESSQFVSSHTSV